MNVPHKQVAKHADSKMDDIVSAPDQFQERLNDTAQETDVLLDRLLGTPPEREELDRPARLLEAMRYTSLGAGKRFRPFLVVESAALFSVPRERR